MKDAMDAWIAMASIAAAIVLALILFHLWRAVSADVPSVAPPDPLQNMPLTPLVGEPIKPVQSVRSARVAHEEIHCLALNIYHEARGESWQGQVAVAEVTLVRAQARNGGVCGEVYRPHQFSWTTDETLRSSKPRGPLYASAVYAAKTALLREQMGLPPFSNGATHYHAKSVRPVWARGMVLVAEIGAHKFYRSTTSRTAS